jgi:hypothetical protein
MISKRKMELDRLKKCNIYGIEQQADDEIMNDCEGSLLLASIRLNLAKEDLYGEVVKAFPGIYKLLGGL